jgi:uncharacterized protein (TIGR02996 family)
VQILVVFPDEGVPTVGRPECHPDAGERVRRLLRFHVRDELARSYVHERRASSRTERDLLHAVRAAPDDDEPRLVLADALAARGSPYGELIALQCAGGDDPAARARERELLAEIARALPGYCHGPVFRRGFMTALTIECRGANPEMLAALAELAEREPFLDDVTLDHDRDVVAVGRLCASALVGRARRLCLAAPHQERIETRTNHATGDQEQAVFQEKVWWSADAILDELAGSPARPAQLTIERAEIASIDWLVRLAPRALELAEARLRLDVLLALATQPQLERLTIDLSAEGEAEQFARIARAPALVELRVETTRAEGLDALLASPGLTALRVLRIPRPPSLPELQQDSRIRVG